MAAGPEDMDLTARFIDRSLHGLAVDGQRRVVVTVGWNQARNAVSSSAGATFTHRVASTVDARSLVGAVDTSQRKWRSIAGERSQTHSWIAL